MSISSTDPTYFIPLLSPYARKSRSCASAGLSVCRASLTRIRVRYFLPLSFFLSMCFFRAADLLAGDFRHERVDCREQSTLFLFQLHPVENGIDRGLAGAASLLP